MYYLSIWTNQQIRNISVWNKFLNNALILTSVSHNSQMAQTGH